LINCQMIRVISSPSISTTGFFTLIFAIGDLFRSARTGRMRTKIRPACARRAPTLLRRASL
jgi:hypothetical protein